MAITAHPFSPLKVTHCFHEPLQGEPMRTEKRTTMLINDSTTALMEHPLSMTGAGGVRLMVNHRQ